MHARLERPRRFRLGRTSALGGAASRGPSRTIIRQATITDVTTWKVSSVRSAIDLHEQGDFSETGLLADAMGRDDRINGVRMTRRRALMGKSGVSFRIAPAFEPEVDKKTRKTLETPETQRAAAIADDVASWWFDPFSESTLSQILDDRIMIGVHVSRVIWERTASSWNIERLKRWHPSNIRWDDARERFLARTEHGEEVIEPNDPNWFVSVADGERSWMAGAVRALGLAFVMRQFDWRDWARFNERHGMPLIAIEEPADYDDAAKRNFYSSVRTMGSTGVVRLPRHEGEEPGFDVRYVEPKDRAWETFKAFMERLDVAIAVTMLGQNLSTEVQGGSFAAATAQMRVRQDFLDADAEGLSTSIRGGERCPAPLSNWARFNKGAEAVALTPWPEWETGVPEDLKTTAEGAKAAGEAVKAWKDAGVRIRNLDEVAERYGLDIEVPDEGDDNDAKEPPDDPDPNSGGNARATRSGLPAAASSGFVEGQEYVDRLGERGAEALAEIFAEDVADLMRIIEAHDDFDTMRQAILTKYQDDLPPSDAQALVEKVVKLAELSGRLAVRQDVPDL